MKTTKIQLVYNYIKSATKNKKKTTYKEISEKTGIPVNMVTVYGRILVRSRCIKYSGSYRYADRMRKSFVDANPSNTKVNTKANLYKFKDSDTDSAKVKALASKLSMVLKFVTSTYKELHTVYDDLQELRKEIDKL